MNNTMNLESELLQSLQLSHFSSNSDNSDYRAWARGVMARYAVESCSYDDHESKLIDVLAHAAKKFAETTHPFTAIEIAAEWLDKAIEDKTW